MIVLIINYNIIYEIYTKVKFYIHVYIIDIILCFNLFISREIFNIGK
jgi:hypothetical protein